MRRNPPNRALCGTGIAALAAATAMLALSQSSLAQQPPIPTALGPGYQLTGAIAPPAGSKITSFDISFVDPVVGRYYLANRTGKDVIVVDVRTNKVIQRLQPGFAGAVGTPV